MKEYFKRLKDHPGLNIAAVMTFLGALAGASNKSFPTPIYGALFGISAVFIFIWLPVLISNRK